MRTGLFQKQQFGADYVWRRSLSIKGRMFFLTYLRAAGHAHLLVLGWS
jgi:hypothetical protein